MNTKLTAALVAREPATWWSPWETMRIMWDSRYAAWQPMGPR
jgi:hypothetical protein